MPNRHAPHSHVSPPPKQAKPCHHCRKPIQLQPYRPPHRCTELCAADGTSHAYNHEQSRPITRYFDDEFNEMCQDCALRPPEKRARHHSHAPSGAPAAAIPKPRPWR